MIPQPTSRRRTNGVEPPTNRKRIKERQHAVPTNADAPRLQETIQTPAQETKALTSAFKLLPVTKKGVCPYCSQHIGKGISGHMQSCQHTGKSRTE